MGVKTKIDIKDITLDFDIKSLKETSSGVSHTVYILNDDYILKVFENDSFYNIESEIKLLKMIETLNVPKVLYNITLKGKNALIFTKGQGKSPAFVNLNQIEQIGFFMKQFHNITKNKTYKNKSIFGNSSLEKLLDKAQNNYFYKIYSNLDIKIKNDGIIHGDLFLDNVTFKDEKLTCVFDFSDACEGDFLFDLAVVGISWCKTKKELQYLLNTYDDTIDFEFFIEYLKYASLYYCVKRFLDNRDYDNILFEKKFKDLI